MLETAQRERTMKFIPQPAEPVGAIASAGGGCGPGMRSACGEIAASLGYAVESTGDLGQARSQLRGRAADILLGPNLPAGSNHGLELVSEVKLLYPGYLGDRHDRVRLGERGRRSHALRRLGLPDQNPSPSTSFPRCWSGRLRAT